MLAPPQDGRAFPSHCHHHNDTHAIARRPGPCYLGLRIPSNFCGLVPGSVPYIATNRYRRECAYRSEMSVCWLCRKHPSTTIIAQTTGKQPKTRTGPSAEPPHLPSMYGVHPFLAPSIKVHQPSHPSPGGGPSRDAAPAAKVPSVPENQPWTSQTTN
jgi:hypothetical protein